MNHRARTAIRRLTAAIRTAVHIGRAARYAALNGRTVADQLASGHLIQGSTFLQTLGLTEQGAKGFRSHYGKCVKAAYRAEHGGRDPQMAWCLIDGRWMQVCVYAPNDPALRAGVAAYRRLADIVGYRALEVA